MSNQNQNSIEYNVVDPQNKIIGKVSTGGTTQLPQGAGTPLSVSKTASGKVTGVSGTLVGNVMNLPDDGK